MAKAKGVDADVEFLSSQQVLRAIEADFFDGPGVPLPRLAELLFNAGDYVYVPGYTARGPVCVSWGRRQQLSWALPDEYCGEPSAVSEEKGGLTAMIYEEARMNAFLARIPADC
jgi:hypothetical protein